MHVIAHTCKQAPQAVIFMAGYGEMGKRLDGTVTSLATNPSKQNRSLCEVNNKHGKISTRVSI